MHEALGGFEQARSDYEYVISSDQADDETMVGALLGLGLLWASRDYTRTRVHYERAIEIARKHTDPSMLARALSRIGNWYSNAGRYSEAREHCDEALLIFRAQDDRRGVAETLDLLGMTCLMGGRFDDSLRFFVEAVALLEEAGDRWTLISSLATIPALSGTYQSAFMKPALPLQQAQVYGDRALSLAQEVAVPAALSYTMWQLSFCVGTQGQCQRALNLAREALEIATGVGHEQWAIAARCALGAIHIDLLDSDRALLHLREARGLAAELNSNAWVSQITALLAYALVGCDELDEAAAIVSDFEPGGLAVGLDSIAQMWVASAALEVADALGDHEVALARAGQMKAAGCDGTLVEHIEGRALLGLDRRDDGRAAFDRAASSARENGQRTSLWRIQADRAALLSQFGEREEARRAANEALAIIDAMAEDLADPALREDFIVKAYSRIPASLRKTSAVPRTGGLTAREYEVAQQVAQGLSNRAIAKRLVLSTRTVETHVANAMSKLGFASRSQLAVWFAERPVIETVP